MNFRQLGLSLAAASAIATFSHGTFAQKTANWWPIKVINPTVKDGPAVVDYIPLEKSSKPYRICALFPHLKDSVWLAVNYGLIDEAKRLGVELNVFEAGGYENLPKQVAQFDDCLAGRYNAIILGAISEGGLAQKLREADAAHIPVIAVLNIITKAKITGRVYAEISDMTKASAAYISEKLAGKEGRIVTFPGPAGSGWAELFAKEFKADVAKLKNVRVIGDRFGDASISVQLGLIQDALQAYPEMNVLYGGAPAIEAADAALQTAGRGDVLLVPAYDNNAVHAMVKSGQIAGFVCQFPVAQARIAMDMAVRSLEGSLKMPYVYPQSKVISTAEMKTLNLTQSIAAPANFSATYSIKAR